MQLVFKCEETPPVRRGELQDDLTIFHCRVHLGHMVGDKQVICRVEGSSGTRGGRGCILVHSCEKFQAVTRSISMVAMFFIGGLLSVPPSTQDII